MWRTSNCSRFSLATGVTFLENPVVMEITISEALVLRGKWSWVPTVFFTIHFHSRYHKHIISYTILVNTSLATVNSTLFRVD